MGYFTIFFSGIPAKDDLPPENGITPIDEKKTKYTSLAFLAKTFRAFGLTVIKF